jgi:cytochrome P450
MTLSATLPASQRAPACPVDFWAADFTGRSYAGYRTIRATAPIVWYRPGHCFLVTRYRDAVSILRDPRFGAFDMFVIWHKLARKLGRDYRDALDLISYFSFRTDDARHDMLRRVVARGVAPYAGGHPAIRQRVDRKLKAAARDGGFDLASDFARYLFFDVMCDLMGIGEEERDLIRAISTETRILEATLSMSFRDEFAASISGHLAILRRHVAAVLERGEPGFIATVHAALPDEETDKLKATATLVTVILMMANDATGGCITFPVLNLLTEKDASGHPLVEQPRWGEISDEAIRYASPVDIVSRSPREDVEIAGSHIRAGELVMLSLMCANHDPAEFGEEADAVSINAGKGMGIPFSAGMHVCVGNRLSRIIIRQAYEALAALPPLRLAGEPTYGDGKVVRTITTLPVEFN